MFENAYRAANFDFLYSWDADEWKLKNHNEDEWLDEQLVDLISLVSIVQSTLSGQEMGVKYRGPNMSLTFTISKKSNTQVQVQVESCLVVNKWLILHIST